MASEKKKRGRKPSMREEFLSKLEVGDSEVARDMSVMTRLNKELVAVLDLLVRLEIFKSRSDAVASIVEETLLSQMDKIELLRQQAGKLDEIQGTAKAIALDVLRREE